MSALLAWLASRTGGALFLSEPQADCTDEKREAFERAYLSIVEGPPGGVLEYACPYAKWEFLRYLVRHKDVALHGSICQDMQVLEPREQTDCSGKRITAVFASRDGIWPLFFAVLNTRGYHGSLRNGCWVVSGGKPAEQRFYFFSVNREMVKDELWTQGMVYILPGAGFQATDKGLVRFDEWASEGAVSPLASLPVKPDDFPFLRQVAGHVEGEPMLRSWWQYKKRIGMRAQ